MKRILTLLVLEAAGVPAATVTVLGTALTLNSSSTPDSAGLWTLDLTYSAGCSPLEATTNPACGASIVLTDPGGDIFASGPRNVRLSVLNSTGVEVDAFPTGVYGAEFTGRFDSNYFGWFVNPSNTFVYFRSGTNRPPRLLQPGETLVVEMEVTAGTPTGSFGFTVAPNSGVIPEPSTMLNTGLGIVLVAFGLSRRRV